MASSDTAIKTILDTVTGLTGNTNLFAGPLRDGGAFPDECVFCLDTGGFDPTDYIDGGSGTTLKETTVQVTIRSDVDEFEEGQTLARACWEAVHKSTPTSHIGATCRTSAPQYIGVDDRRRHMWTINVDLLVRE